MNPGRRARIETEERFMIPALTIDELQMQAQRRLPKPIYDFIDGAAYDEATKVANRQDFLSLRLRQRVLRDIAVRDHGTTILGQESSDRKRVVRGKGVSVRLDRGGSRYIKKK